MVDPNGSKLVADYIHQELVRLHGPRYSLLGQEERERLFKAGVEYNNRFPVKLIAHGVDSIGFQTLAKIFFDGKLKHYTQQENYGALGVPYTGMTGHWDNGLGLFVATRDKVVANKDIARGSIYSVPLEDVEAVVFPTEVAEVVRHTFPSRAQLVKGYTEYANDLEIQNMIFDLDHKRKGI